MHVILGAKIKKQNQSFYKFDQFNKYRLLVNRWTFWSNVLSFVLESATWTRLRTVVPSSQIGRAHVQIFDL